MAQRRRVLLVCDYDPTSPLIGPLRVDSFARYLTELGWSVRVLSRSGVTVYDEHGRTAPAGAQDSHYQRPLRAPCVRLLRKLLAAVYVHLVAFPDRGIFGVRPILGHADDLGQWRPDLIAVSGPPFSTFLVARTLAGRWAVPWVADYRDLWTNSTYYVCGPVRRRLDRFVERWILRTVSLAVTVSEPLADDLRRDFKIRCAVVMNGFDSDEVPDGARATPTIGLPVRLIYTGEIYTGKRDPAPLFQALKLLDVGPDTISVELRGITVLPLQEEVERFGVEDLVQVGPALPRADCLARQQASDAQILLMWDHPDEAGNYTGKLFEYLGSRRPILMLGYEHGVAADLIRERGAGYVANTPEAIAEVLSRWIELKRSTGTVPASREDVVAGLTRRDQAAVLEELLAGLLTGSTEARGERGGVTGEPDAESAPGDRPCPPECSGPSKPLLG